jgi:type III secretory pathway component EscR
VVPWPIDQSTRLTLVGIKQLIVGGILIAFGMHRLSPLHHLHAFETNRNLIVALDGWRRLVCRLIFSHQWLIR